MTSPAGAVGIEHLIVEPAVGTPAAPPAPPAPAPFPVGPAARCPVRGGFFPLAALSLAFSNPTCGR
jgi:hypothetical protein